jgi:beta-lactamase superfamily II metal-dependent hydrolase
MVDINNGDDIDYETAMEIASETPSPLDDWRLPLANARNESKKAILKEAGYDVELTNPIEFYLRNYGTEPIFRYIQTHPHLDHVRGLVALRDAGIGISNFWDTNHRTVPEFVKDGDEEEWAEYDALRCGRRPGVTVLRLNQGDGGPYYNQDPGNPDSDGDGLSILAPTPELNREVNAAKAPNVNNLSYVLRFSYRGVKVVLGGDAESAVWEAIHQRSGKRLKCNVLKASHHGRDSGFHQKTVEAMSPWYTIVSVGRKPDTDASNKYRNYSKEVWSTRWQGDITLTISDKGKWWMTSQNRR